MEHCRGGDLCIPVSNVPIGEQSSLITRQGVLAVLPHILSIGTVHRDVKPKNVILGQASRPVLCDFGVAARLGDMSAMSKRVGSPGYVALEVIRRKHYGTKNDINATCVMLHYMTDGRAPFAGRDPNDSFLCTLEDITSLHNASVRTVSSAIKTFKLWAMSPATNYRSSTSCAAVLWYCHRPNQINLYS